ncbi:MAG: hypothetical protein ACYC25_10650 [Paludibacter sp.]
MRTEKPVILLFDEFIKPIDNAKTELIAIKEFINIKNDNFILKGLFVYSTSLFESSLTDSLKKYLIAFPNFIDDGSISSKDIIFLSNASSASDVLEHLIDNYIHEISFKNHDKVMTISLKIMGINNNDITYNRKELKERKARRNILVHNNLFVDKVYINQAGCNPDDYGKQLSISSEYLTDALSLFLDILEQIRTKLYELFSEYNRERLIKNVWNYVFQSSLLRYEDYWGKGYLDIMGNKDKISSISSGEKTWLAYWIQHYNSAEGFIKFSEMNYFSYHTDKMIFLSQFFDRYPHILQY